MKRQFSDHDGAVHSVSALGETGWLATTEDGEREVTARVRRCSDGSLLIEQGGITRPAQLSRSGDDVWVTSGGATTRWRRYEQRRGAAAESGNSVMSPMTGKVVVVSVVVGDVVSKGDVLVVVEAMKMEQPLLAPREGGGRAGRLRGGSTGRRGG